MKLSTLLELIGSGSVLLGVGVLMIALGTAFGFSEATHLPYWASLSGIGLLSAIVGYVIFDRGTEETEEQVKKLPIVEALHSPWLVIGAAVAGGMLLARLTQGRREKATPSEGTIATPTAPEKLSEQPESSTTKKDDAHSLSHYIGDELRTLGSLASGIALTLGMKALGIPPVEQLLAQILGGETEPGPLVQPVPVATNEKCSETAATDRCAANSNRGNTVGNLISY